MNRTGRADTSRVGRWWWTLDHWTLSVVLLLVVCGVIMSFAAGLPIARNRGFNEYHFVYNHLIFLGPALATMLWVSLLRPMQVRRFAGALYLAAMVAVALTLIIGEERNGSTRWLPLPLFDIQPSEFLKPAFAVTLAWVLSGRDLRFAGWRAHAAAIAMAAATVPLLVMQNDFGQAFLTAAIWGGVYFMAGMAPIAVAALLGSAVGGLLLAYEFAGHVRERIDAFFGSLEPSAAPTQVSIAMDAVRNGGWLGQGPGAGVFKLRLPDAHTDYVFAVVAEEYGALACLWVAGMFAFVVLRNLVRVADDSEGFIRLAVGGLSVQFGFQAIINIAVNLNVLPPKGMTLPFISYGGSSLLASSITIGMILALTRRRPRGTLS